MRLKIPFYRRIFNHYICPLFYLIIMEVSVIVPVYNEVNAIEGTISQLHDTLKKARLKYELIIVNDGSDRKSVV